MKVPWSLRGDVSEETLDAIAAAVDEAESRTSGEIHVHIVHALPPLEKPRDRAVHAFQRLGMHRTRHRNGVLVFVAMKKRCFEIVADEGIDQKVGAEVWDEIAEAIAERIDHDGFAAGISTGIQKIGVLLAEHFPPEVDDTNELPNRPSLG
jgi:uncharacterized membrane protein